MHFSNENNEKMYSYTPQLKLERSVNNWGYAIDSK